MSNFYQNFLELKSIDTQNMFEILKNFPEQVIEACEIGKNAPLFKYYDNPKQFVILGMGGSAIGGNILRSYTNALEGANHLSIITNRNYTLPKNINENAYIVASSYSGNTEETLSAYEQSLPFSNHLLAIASGGKLQEMAEKNNIPLIKIPSGFQPRCALGYSFFPMLFVMLRTGAFKKEAIDITNEALSELITLLKEKSELYSEFTDRNKALELAKSLHGTVPIIYSSLERMDSVNLRWRCQIQENAKNSAFGSLLPEMNHNEINGWSYPANAVDKFSIILLEDIDDNPRIKIRFEALKSLLNANKIISIESKAKNLLTRMFDLIYLGDWTSYYLALLNGIDPTPIPLITKLKNFLSEQM